MNPIAYSEGVSVFSPEDGKCSFFNSPYPSHSSFRGIDVYPKGGFGDVAPSPVGGEVIRVRSVKCPKGRGFSGSSKDFIILLRSSENPERCVKILHVKPFVEVGDVVKLGEGLGTLLRSGFFNFWTDPHLHVEVRKPTDPIRARGGLEFERVMEVGASKSPEELIGRVIESKPEYCLVALNREFEYGLPVELDGQCGVLDAGIPHYRWVGVHMDTQPRLNSGISLCGRKIGIVKSAHSNMGVAECCNPVFTLKGKPVGLSLYLYPHSTPLVKVIPRSPGGLALERSEEVSVTVE